jgi:hypothetical protein
MITHALQRWVFRRSDDILIAINGKIKVLGGGG